MNIANDRAAGLASTAGSLVSPVMERRAAILAFLAALALFLLAAAFDPPDLAEFANGDTLYVIHMLEYGLLEYRPPLSNRWAPDALLHLAISPAGLEPAMQSASVGIVIFIATSAAILLWKGPLALGLYLLVLSTVGFEFANSINHFSLPITVLAYLWAQRRPAEPVILFAIVFFNPFVLFPLALAFVEPDTPRRQLLRAAVTVAALVANTIYTELSTALAMLAVAFPVWLAAAFIAGRLGLRDWYLMALMAGLAGAVALGLAPMRYGIPVAACVPLFLFPWRSPRIAPLPAVVPALALPVLAVALFFVSLERERHDRLAADYDCLLKALDSRGITMVATDHWNAKPLHFAAKAKGRTLGIVQTRFDDGTVHTVLAPYDFYGAPTRWAVRGRDSCEEIAEGDPVFCGQPDIAPVVSSESLCRNFELYEYAVELPLRAEARPSGKLSSLWRNFQAYAGQLRRLANT